METVYNAGSFNLKTRLSCLSFYSNLTLSDAVFRFEKSQFSVHSWVTPTLLQACMEAVGASGLYALACILISFLQVHAKIISGFTFKQSKSAFPFMIGTTVPVQVSECHLKMHSASETRSRTAKTASERNYPTSSAQ